MEVIKKENIDAWKWLQKEEYETWARSHFAEELKAEQDPTKHVKPPPVRGIGRPRKERMIAEDENENGHVQKKRKMTCNKCKGEGHNAKSCKGESTIMDRAKLVFIVLASYLIACDFTCCRKIVRKTKSGIKMAKYKPLRSGSDGLASDTANDVPPSTRHFQGTSNYEKPPVKAVEKPSLKPVQPRPRFKVVRVADP
ncbi:hypothetical protein IFM89_037938 [Coptis chinensis]|uniref:CCHC-type domain-containing protein n=1 Tax=Coptis chinensis TaxID=261450 RepID=A0A835LUH4_9MAGN|nr:hypothetical protein IFM89_037938 [Coptis chinensis]